MVNSRIPEKRKRPIQIVGIIKNKPIKREASITFDLDVSCSGPKFFQQAFS